MPVDLKFLISALVTLVAGCAPNSPPASSLSGEGKSAKGQVVSICGQMVSPNVIWSHSGLGSERDKVGVYIFDRGPVERVFRGSLCVEGTVRYTGCQTGGNICTDAIHDYGIWIERVLSSQ